MNGRYLIVERFAAVLLTASLALAGCERGEAGAESEAPPASSQAPAPASERSALAADSPAPEAHDPAASTPASSASAPEPADAGAEEGGAGARAERPSTAPPDRAQPAPAEASPAPRRPSSQDPSQEEILRATSRAYEGLRSFRAEFDQTLRNTILGRTTRSAGTVYQRQPDRFLMRFSDPEDDLIVSDGDFFWMYFPSVDAKQVLRTPRGAQGLDLHAQFIGDPVRRFETTYHGTETVRGRRAHVMTLVPRERMGYQRLKVWIDADDHLVRRFELTETNENVRHFELRNMVKNPTLPDTLFEFTPPPGAQVVTR